LTPLEVSFSLSVGGNKEKEESQLKVIETISMNIRTLGSSSNVKINIQGSDKEKMKSIELLSGFRKVFSWFNAGLHGFDPGLVQHIMKTTKKKQRLVNYELEATFRRELRNSLRNEMFSFVHPKEVSNWEPA
jgi:predicted N-acyltransferase